MTFSATFKRFVVVVLLAAGVLVAQPSLASAVGTTPSAPTALAVQLVGADFVQFSWTAPASNGGSAITQYEVRFSDDGGITWAPGDPVTPPALFAIVSPLSTGVTYRFEVAAVNGSGVDTGNGAGVGAWSAPLTAIPSTIPEAPGAPSAVNVHRSSIDLQWSANGDGGQPITDYTVEAQSHRVADLDAGANHSCVVMDDGSVRCWGKNDQQQLGLGDTVNRGDGPNQMGANLPAVDLAGHTAQEVSTGADHSCALLDDSSVRCWGNNTGGRLGVGDTTSVAGAVNLGTNHTAKEVSAGNGFTCAVLDDGSVKCWGVNNVGQLGQGDTTLRGGTAGSMGDGLAAVDLGTDSGTGNPNTAVAVSAGDSHVCVLLDAPSNLYPVKCWGNGANGQLGQESIADIGSGPGEMGDNLAPIDLGTGLLATQVSAGGNSTCAVLSDGATNVTKCWGANGFAQLGLGDTADRGGLVGQMGDALPAVQLGDDGAVPPTPHYPIEMTNALDHTCVRLEDGSVRCWGNNAGGKLGLGIASGVIGDSPTEMGNSLPAVNIGTGRVSTDVETGDTHTCALLDDASVRCWGGNADGQLGLGDVTARGGSAGQMGDLLPRTFTPTVVTVDAGLPVGSPLTATIGGLEPGALQSIRVAATNAVGPSAWSEPLLQTPHGPATQPTGLVSTGVTGTSVSLSWTAPPFAGTPLTGYVVQYSTTGGEPWTTFLDGGSTVTSTTVTGLTKGQLTSFRVAAINGDGYGDFSAIATGTPATLPSAPLNLVTVPGHISFQVGWDLPADDGGTSITDYVVQYRVHGTADWSTLADGVSASTVAEINSLIPDGHYDVQVAAVNAIGTGPFSAVATADLVPGPPRAPTNVHVTAKSGSSITVAWSPPADDGGSPITQYRVILSLAAGGVVEQADLPNTDSSYVFPGANAQIAIQPGTDYIVTVAASNEGASPGIGFVGFGPASADLAVTTPTLPGKPTGLHTTAVSGVAISVAWDAPASDGGASLSDYKVQYKLHTDDWSLTTFSPNPFGTSFAISNLTPGTSYDIRVKAVNIVGAGVYSDPITVNTPNHPDAPTALHATARTGTTVSLAWTAPASDGGAPISDYLVEYKAPSDSDFTTFVHSASTTPSTTVTGLTQGLSYTFRVSAVNLVGPSSPSLTTTGVPYTTPGKPGTPTGTPGNRTVALKWLAPADNGGNSITAYKVERSTNGTTWTLVTLSASASTRTYTVGSLTNGTGYRFRVSAINAAGTGTASSASAVVVPRTVATAPGKPVIAPWNTQIGLSWSAPASNGGAAVTAYKVERSTNGGAWSTLTTTASASTRSFVVTHLVNGVSYRFRVSAKNAAGFGAVSLIATGSPKAVPGAPGRPAAVAGVGRVTLTWAAPANRGSSAIRSYRVQRSTDGITWTTVTSSAPLTRSFTVTGLVRGKAYRFRVAAINTLGAGAWSAVATATPR